MKFGSVENLERLAAFFENVQDNKDDSVRVASYTVEGDPIFQEAIYKNGKITYRLDTKLAKAIIETVEKKEVYKSLPPVQGAHE